MTPSGAMALVGMAVVHSVWIGTLMAMWTAVSLLLLRDARPVARYRVAMAGFALAALLPLLALLGEGGSYLWLRWIGTAWLAGAVVLTIQVGNSLQLVRRLRESSRPIAEPWPSMLGEIAAGLEIGQSVLLAESDLVEVPCSAGLRSPAIILPPGLLPGLTPAAFRAIAAHELAHVARRDYLWNLVQIGFETLLFFHPAARWLSKTIHRERELCCDEIASAACDPLTLARALASVERERDIVAARADTSLQQPLLERMHWLLAQSTVRARQTATSRHLIGVTAVGGAGLLFSTLWTSGLANGQPALWLPWFAAAGLGLLVGLRHAFEPDHLIAVATLVTRARDTRSAIRLGTSWGVGHTASLLGVGSMLALARQAMPDYVGTGFEALVAVMITAMGVHALLEGWRLGARGPAQSHAHGGATHTHATLGAHIHVGPWAIARRPLIVGVVHGLAGSGALTALAVSSLPSIPAQVGFMLVFGLGSTAGMAAVAGVAGWQLARVVRTRTALAGLSVATGLAAVSFGAVWGYPLLVKLIER